MSWRPTLLRPLASGAAAYRWRTVPRFRAAPAPPAAASTRARPLALDGTARGPAAAPVRGFHASAPVPLSLRRRSRRRGAPPAPIASPGDDADDADDSDDDKDGPAPTAGEGPAPPSAGGSGPRYAAVTDAGAFAAAAAALVDRLFGAIQPMGRVNDPFFLTRGYEDDLGPFLLLDLGPVRGQYTVQVDLPQTVVTLTTPRLGQIAYVLRDATRDWVSAADGHSLEGMLVRELIHVAQGLPNL